MRRFLSRLPWALICACAVGLTAAWPLLSIPGLAGDTDAELHVYRTAELGYSLRAGALYPRWAPDFYHGYGYPIFNYYAPLTYYLSYALALMRPEAAAAGVKATLILAQVVGAIGAYQLGRLFGRKGGGLLGALAFSFSPYVQLINPYVRGAVAESLALGFLPWALWGWEMLWRRGRRALLPAVLATSAVLLSHNLSGLSCLALVSGLGLWRGLGRWRKRLHVAIVAAAVFALLTAFFWLPFVVERAAVQLNVAGEGHYDFRNHFVPVRQLLALVEPLDRRAASARVPMSVGAPVLLLAIIGLGCRLRQRHRSDDIAPYAVAAVGCLWLVTPGSQWFWETLPGLSYYQFPWRFLGPAAACLVPLVASLISVAPGRSGLDPGDAVARGHERYHALLLVAVAGLVVVIAGLPGLYPVPWEPTSGSITPLTIVDKELEGRWRGTTSTNDFVPGTVEMIPGPAQSVLDSYKDSAVDRVNRHTLPVGTTVRVVADKPWINRFEVTGTEGFTLRLYLFQFPGWRATVDGQEAPIVVAHPEGFITVSVPPGEHEVVVRFGSTAARRWGWALSAVGVTALLFAASRGGAIEQQLSPRWPAEARDRHDTAVVACIGVLLACLVCAKAAVLDHVRWLQPLSPASTVSGAENAQRADLGGEITFLGYDLDPDHSQPGATIEVVLYWSAQFGLTETYQSFVHLVSPEGTIWSQSDHLNPGGFPTNLWPTDRYIVDVHRLRIPVDAPPGPYLVSVGLYALSSANSRLPVRTADCGMREDSLTLCRPFIVRR